MKITVLGDLILDRYINGTVTRTSPEAPVPVVDVTDMMSTLGGAGNVCKNLRTLDSDLEIEVLGVVGNDDSGHTIVDSLIDLDIDVSGIEMDKVSPTTVKTRIVNGSQQIARVDEQISEPRDWFEFNVSEDTDVLVVSDYDLGVIGESYFAQQDSLTSRMKVVVDPKFRNFWDYRGVYCFKPNKKELWDALCRKWTKRVLELNDIDSTDTPSMIKDYMMSYKMNKHRKSPEHILVTEGRDGMTLLKTINSQWEKLQTEAQNVFDVTGAGDTVTAILAYCTALRMEIFDASWYANYGASISIQQIGCGVVTADQLFGGSPDIPRGTKSPSDIRQGGPAADGI